MRSTLSTSGFALLSLCMPTSVLKFGNITEYKQNPHEAAGGSFQQQDCYTIGKTTFAYRSWSEASRLRNSALKIRSDLASALFNCDHHFSALCSSSQTISVHVNSSPNSSQLFSFFSSLSTSPQFFFIAFHLFSSRLFSPDASPHLNSSHLLLEVEKAFA